MRDAREGWYDIGQVCLNGHPVNSGVRSGPEFSSDHCGECGAATITECPACNVPIRGYYHGGGISLGKWEPSAYCLSCGQAYPWTLKKMRIAKELLEELEMDAADRQTLEQSFEVLQRSGSEVEDELATRRIRKVMGKVGKATASAVYRIAVDLGSETAKKLLTEPW